MVEAWKARGKEKERGGGLREAKHLILLAPGFGPELRRNRLMGQGNSRPPFQVTPIPTLRHVGLARDELRRAALR